MPVLSTLGAAIANVYGFTSGLIKDQYFNLVSLLLPGNGTNGAQNNTFLDSSSNNFTITRNGDTTQGTFSPFSQTGWGNYFNGSSYLQVASNAAFALGTGDFSIEFWFYPTVAATQRNISFPTANAPILNMTSSRTLEFGNYGISTIATTSNTLTLNAWNFCAASRVSGTLRLFINGVQGASVPDSTNFVQSLVNIGTDTGGIFATGYMADVRIVKGSGFTTSTVPTAPLTAISGTSLLTCQSNRFRDASGNGFTITTSGSPSVTPFSPFAPTSSYSAAAVGGSGYFDGIGDYLTAADNAAFTLGTSDFTIEAWVYALSSGTTDRYFIAHADNASAAGSSFAFYIFSGTSKIYFECYISSSTTTITSDSAIVLNQWNHVAICRSGGTLAMFVNGTRQASPASISTSSINNCANSLSVGARTTGGSTYTGYLASSRMVVGTDIYGAGNSTITVPTAPLTAVTNTQLLLNFTNAGVVDATAKNDLQTVGNAQISNGAGGGKWGGGSLYFDGSTNTRAQVSSSAAPPLMNMGTGDYTVEFWMYAATPGSQQCLFDFRVGDPSGQGVALLFTTSRTLFIYYNGATRLTTSAISASTWTHIAMVRSSGVYSVYINGTASGGTWSNSDAVAPTANRPYIGAVGDGSQVYNGYMDDFRISRFARYTANFTAPTAPFPVQ